MRHFDWLAIKRTVDSLGEAARLVERRVVPQLWCKPNEGRLVCRLVELARRLQALVERLYRLGQQQS